MLFVLPLFFQNDSKTDTVINLRNEKKWLNRSPNGKSCVGAPQPNPTEKSVFCPNAPTEIYNPAPTPTQPNGILGKIYNPGPCCVLYKHTLVN